jgi:PadR family transcriptional regulator AphA
MAQRATLALNEWAVLAVVAERPRHGYDIAAELDRETEIGRAWRLGRPIV